MPHDKTHLGAGVRTERRNGIASDDLREYMCNKNEQIKRVIALSTRLVAFISRISQRMVE